MRMTGGLLVLVLAFLPAQGEDASEAVKVERNIVYSSANGEKMMLDLARPAKGGPHPAVLLLHGGAWSLGSRKDLSVSGRKGSPSLIEQIADRGYVVASASYRLAPKHKFPAQIEDVRTAIRFLRANAKKYDLDPDRVAVGGFSAGGHLSLLAGLADKGSFETEEHAGHASKVNCVVSFFGPTDLSLYAASEGLEDAYMVPWLGKACKTDKTLYTKASPIEYVSKDDPPVLMIHGTADFIVPIVHSERLLKKFQDAGVKSDLIVVRGEGHGWSGKIAEKTTQDALQFLDEQLKGKK